MRVATHRHSVADRLRGRAWRRGAAGAFLLGVALAADAAAATRGVPRASVERAPAAVEGPVQVSVRVEGRDAPLYQAWNRPDRWYLEARAGGRYEVRVRNLSDRRVGFVLSVDGLNAIDGRQTSLSPDEPLYVLDPHESATIRGWRRSLRDVNRFVFVDEERSYAERTGQGNGDLGWIRVVAYEEREAEIRWRDSWGRVRGGAPQAAPEGGVAPQARRDVAAPQDEGNPGTGWGSRERDPVRTVQFEPERVAAAHVILRYEYRSGLVALGILPWRGGDRDRLGEREDGVYGFAQPPQR